MRRLAKSLIVKYLENQAKRILHRHRPKIVAVAGSVGKTSTKLYVAAMLRQKYRVLAHPGSYNTDLGVPLSILNLQRPERLFNPFAWLALLARASWRYLRNYPFDVIVLELGTDKPGDITYLMRYLKPAVGIITAVTPEHMEGFGTMEAVLEEEFALAQGSDHVLLNASDAMLNVKRRELKHDQIATFGLDRGEYWFQFEGVGRDGRLRGALHVRSRNLPVRLQLIAKHAAIGLTAAAAVADIMKLNDLEITTGAESIEPVVGRMNPLAGLKGSTIIDDSYNSSPDAAIAALNTLYEFPATRRSAIMGSMNELGEYSREGHENVGQRCNKLTMLVTVGEDARKYLAAAAIDSGLSKTRVKSFKSPYKAGQFVKQRLRRGDVILVKGSQNGIFTEEAAKQLLANPDDAHRLVRQTPFWLERKAKQFKEAKS